MKQQISYVQFLHAWVVVFDVTGCMETGGWSSAWRSRHEVVTSASHRKQVWHDAAAEDLRLRHAWDEYWYWEAEEVTPPSGFVTPAPLFFLPYIFKLYIHELFFDLFLDGARWDSAPWRSEYVDTRAKVAPDWFSAIQHSLRMERPHSNQLQTKVSSPVRHFKRRILWMSCRF